METVHVELTDKGGELGTKVLASVRSGASMPYTHIVMLEMAPQNAPAELSDIAHHKGSPELIPLNEVLRLGVRYHPANARVSTRSFSSLFKRKHKPSCGSKGKGTE